MFNDKLSKIILAMVVLVVLGLAVYFIMPKNLSPIVVQPKASPTITPIVTPTPEPTETLTPTATAIPILTPDIDISDWKIYRNKEYGFELKYPKDWEHKIQEAGLGTDYGIKFSNFKNQDDYIFFDLGLAIYPAAQDAGQYAQEDFTVKNYKIETKKDIIIDGINGVEYISNYNNLINRKYIAAYWFKGRSATVDQYNSFYLLETSVKLENKSKEVLIINIFNQMLSTIKFD